MKSNKIPMRRCIGCNISKPQKELIRIACYEGKITVDFDGNAKGRGVYVCKDKQCLKKIFKKKGFIRAFGVDLSEEQKERLLEEITKYEKDK